MDPAAEVLMKAEALQGPMNAVIDRGDSPIQQFYQGAVVFITGGTGFLGKQLVEKLFRACKIKKLYLLMRAKKGKTMLERLQSALEDPVFDLVREKQPNFGDKIYPVEGDVAALKLGLSDKDWNTLANDVEIIFHLAATVRFDEHLKLATLINVRGTCEAVELARKCKKIRRFVHVSTAFAHASEERIGKEVEEKFYPAPMPADVIIQMVESLDEDKLDNITQPLIKGWPNTYTFTKAIAEKVIQEATDIPTCVVKPPVVTPCHSEPKAGWLDLGGMAGPSGIFLGVGLGVFHVIKVNKSSRLATVPLDYVNNAIIASAWDAEEREKSGDKETPVYIVSNEDALVRWVDNINIVYVYFIYGTLFCAWSDMHLAGFFSIVFLFNFYAYQMRNDCRKLASLVAVWYCFLIETTSDRMYWIIATLLHYVPAYIFDAICAIIGKRPKQISSVVKVYEKIDKKVNVYRYFLLNEWLFRDYNVKAMIRRMNDADKAIFNCDINKIDFALYTQIWVCGIRKFILKDHLRLSDSVKAIRRQKIFQVANYIVGVLYAYALWSIASTIFSVVKYIVCYLLYIVNLLN